MAALLVVAIGAEAEALVPQAQSRIASLERTYHGNRCEYPPPFSCTSPECGPYTASVLEEETASGFEPFDASVSLEGPPMSGAGGSASQTSAVESNQIVASGSYSGYGGYGGDFDFCGNPWDASCSFEGDSWFSVSFDVVTATPYTLIGTLEGAADLYYGPSDVSIFARLTGPGGTVAEATCVFPPESPVCGPVSLDEAGLPPPGSYTLEARAKGPASGGDGASIPDGGSSGSFDIVLAFAPPPVPALSARGLTLLVALTAAIGACRVSRILS